MPQECVIISPRLNVVHALPNKSKNNTSSDRTASK